ncbi:MAG: O-acetylhomoserine sulfhydrylase (EC @ O-succinylhomoserine sulfhydrylase (EC [uncultured Paraburkholderia sp.]|nr:MAG: O-acetylhomoserine sulfhydrylase (EC @ O-succinylhomoserine sulfhydrylase (EC [uncultured Paraburkholderia sp.]
MTDTGLFDWSAYPNIADDYRRAPAKEQGLLQIRKKGLRDMGASLSSERRTPSRWAPRRSPCG